MSHRQYCAFFFFFQLKNLYEGFAYYLLDYRWGLTDGSADKESACNAGDTGDVGLIPGLRDLLERSLERETSTHSCILA